MLFRFFLLVCLYGLLDAVLFEHNEPLPIIMFFLPFETDPTTATIQLDVGAGATTFTPAYTDTNAYDLLNSFVYWANTTTALTFTFTTARHVTTGGVVFTLNADATYTVDFSAMATTLLGLPDSAGAATTVGTAPAINSIYPLTPTEVSLFHPVDTTTGDCSGAGAVREQLPATAAEKPLVTLYLNHLEASRLAFALVASVSPRLCTVYQQHTDTYKSVHVGNINRSKEAHRQYSYELEVLA